MCPDPLTEEEIKKANLGEPPVLNSTVLFAEYSAEWPKKFQTLKGKIEIALSHLEISMEHVGSTSVPGLAAKPVIDIVLAVPNSADENSYVSQLESISFILKIREPEWFEHRVLKTPDLDVNLHVFTHGCSEIDKLLTFRDHLRTNKEDLKLYESTKRELASRKWKYIQNYADAKSEVIAGIMKRAMNKN